MTRFGIRTPRNPNYQGEDWFLQKWNEEKAYADRRPERIQQAGDAILADVPLHRRLMTGIHTMQAQTPADQLPEALRCPFIETFDLAAEAVARLVEITAASYLEAWEIFIDAGFDLSDAIDLHSERKVERENAEDEEEERRRLAAAAGTDAAVPGAAGAA